MKQNLFQGIISYLRKNPSFQIKNLISEIGYLEVQTVNKLANRNPFYRTRQYVSYLCRCGYLKRTGHGYYLVIKPIPTNFTLSMVHTQLGYVYKPKAKTKVEQSQVSTGQKIANNSVYGAYGVNSEDSPYEKSLNRLKDAIQTIQTLKEKESEKAPGPTVEKIAFSESMFANQKPKPVVEMQEIINVGHIRSALACLDDIVTTDTVLHARIINVISILKTIDSDLHTKIKLNG